ncbi:MAG: DUF1441 family protein [Porticoccaceae bacterium]|nr:DUF1441 family protein [Porticoccaceae bacterium]
MSKVIDLSRGVLLSLRQMADETGFDRGTIARRIDEARLRPSGKRGGHPVYRMRDVLKLLFLPGGEDFDPDDLDPFKRRAYYQGELDKMKVGQERGELVPRMEVEREQARILGRLVQFCDTLPDIVERDVGATPQQLEAMERTIDRLRDDLYADLVEEDTDAGGAIRDRS